MSWIPLKAKPSGDVRIKWTRPNKWVIYQTVTDDSMPRTNVVAYYDTKDDAQCALRHAGYRPTRYTDASGYLWILDNAKEYADA